MRKTLEELLPNVKMTVPPWVDYDPDGDDDLTPYKIKIGDVTIESFHTKEEATMGLDAYRH